MIGVKVSTCDWVGRNIARARIIVISENQRLDSHVEDRIDDKQYAVFRGRFSLL